MTTPVEIRLRNPYAARAYASTPYPQWGLSWSYDRFGNRTAQTRTHGSTAPQDSPTISTSTNRITVLNTANLTYDSNGNLTQDDLYKYKYDAENRMVELRQLNDTLIASYAFDGNSLRVVKVWGADRTFYLYAGTQLISEFEDAASNTYSAGTTPGQAPADSTTIRRGGLYQHSDHLTTRLTTDNFGNLSNEQAHYPYGEQWYATGTADPSVLRKFTSYQKEDEAASGKLNYAVFREHSARVGRFLLPDFKRDPRQDPQALNLYSYVAGNPITRFDPMGLDWCTWCGIWAECGVANRFNSVQNPACPSGDVFPTNPGRFAFTKSACGDIVTPPILRFTGGGTAGVGNHTLPAVTHPGCAVPAPSTPQCFAQLKGSPLSIPGVPSGNIHTFWWVQDSSGQRNVVTGGPERRIPGAYGRLLMWVVAGNTGHGGDSSGDHTYWPPSSNLSNDTCSGVELLLNAARNFNGRFSGNHRLNYDPYYGPNSNSAARYVGAKGGFNPPPPLGATGWDYIITDP